MSLRVLLIALLSLVLLVAVGCERYVDSKDPVRSLPSALPAPTNLEAQLDSRAVILTWQFSNPAAAGKYYIYQSTNPVTGFTLRDSTTTTEIRIQNLTAGQLYFFEVAAIDAGGLEGLRSDTVSVRAAFLSISIAGGDEYTRQTSVQLRLSAPTDITAEMIVSEDSALAGAAVRPFQSQLTFSLSAGDGLKTVYARFIFSDGTESEIVSDDIILDTEADIDSVTWLPDTTEFSVGEAVDFFVYTGEAGGEAGVTFSGVTVRLLDDGSGTDAVAGDGIYSGQWTVPDDIVISGITVTGQFEDAAGNRDTRIADKTISVVSTPLPVTLTSASALSSWEVTLDWTEGVSEGFAAYVVRRDTLQPVTESSDEVMTITSPTVTAYTDTTVDETTTYYYRVFLENVVGRAAGSNTTSVTTPANLPPDTVVLAASVQAGDALSVLLSWTASTAGDFASYRIYRSTSAAVDTTDQLIRIVTNPNQTSASDAYSVNNRWYRIFVYDRQGKATGSNVVEAIN